MRVVNDDPNVIQSKDNDFPEDEKRVTDEKIDDNKKI